MSIEAIPADTEVFMVHSGRPSRNGEDIPGYAEQMQRAVEALRQKELKNPHLLASATIRALQSAEVIREGLGLRDDRIPRSTLLHVAGQTPDGVEDLERLIAASVYQGKGLWDGRSPLIVVADGDLAHAVKHGGKLPDKPLMEPGELVPVDFGEWNPTLRKDFRTAHLGSAVARIFRREDLYEGV